MTKYLWIKLKDITGEVYEFEDSEMVDRFRSIDILFTAPIGVVKKTFYKKNLVSMEFIKERE